jgi:hypothetical protein
MARSDPLESFVPHPRYGKRPRFTESNPQADFQTVHLHWHSSEECRIPGTAIQADLRRQTPATVPVTHYFDVRSVCRDCGRPFIFFADEQKHWYEELGFGLDSNCVRCPPCRKKERGIARKRERYEELFHAGDRDIEQDLEMVECCLSLMEQSIFSRRQTQRVRVLLHRVPETRRLDGRIIELSARLRKLETANTKDGAAEL